MNSRDATIVGGIRWQLSPAGLAMFAADDLLLASHIKSGRAITVKEGEHRAVYRVQLANDIVYWKHCRLNGSRAWWRDLLRGPKAKLEYDRLTELTRREVATVEPLAWGQFDGAWPRGSFLITRALDGTAPLDEYLSIHPPSSARERRILTRAIADYISALHAAGVSHPDFHPGNVLVRNEAGKLQFYLIDVHDSRLGPPLSRRERLANLTLWNRWFRMRATRSDRLRFWIAYAGREGSRDDCRKLEESTEQSIAKLWQSRDARCLRVNRDFRRIRSAEVDGYCARELNASFAAKLIADPDAIFQSAGAIVLKDSRSSTVCTIPMPTANGPLPMVIKRIRVRHWYDPLVNAIRPSPALRSWKNGHALIARGLPTPRPWLFLQRKRFGLATAGYLLCERIDNATHLLGAVETADAAGLGKIVIRVARWIRLMHERGIAHRDLKAANILVTADGECQFLDLVGVRTLRRVPRHIRVRDLMRLNASFLFLPGILRTTRLRFLRTYLVWGLRGREGWKEWWNEVKRATEEKVRQNVKRNRPLA